MQDKSCKTPRWRLLKAQLNNLGLPAFYQQFKTSKQAILIDVRTPDEYQSGHLPGAINISYLADNFWDQIEQIDSTQKVFVYCRSGRRSIRTCTLMRNGGFDNNKIFNLDGGYTHEVHEQK